MQNLIILKTRFDLSPFIEPQKILLNKNILPEHNDVLLTPSNIYVHRRFFSDKDFLGNRAKYYYDICSNGSFKEVIQNFNYVFLVKNDRLLDKRIDQSLVTKSKNCDPNLNYYEILKSNSYSLIVDTESGALFKRNEKN
jgi:hypothetical protein